MVTENMKRRDIKKTWTVNAQRVSPIHTAGAILEPGHWQEFDPFLLLMEDQFSKGAFDFHPHRGLKPSPILLMEESIIMIMQQVLEVRWKKGIFNL